MIQLKDRNGEVLKQVDADSYGAALEHCASARIPLPGLDASGQDLSGRQLAGLKAPGIVLRGARVSGADVSYADLSGGNLDQLQGAGLTAVGVNLTDATGLQIAIPDADLTDSVLHRFEAPRIQAAGIVLDGAQGDAVNFNAGQLSDMSARDAKFPNSQWRNAVVTNSSNELSEFISVEASGIQAQGSDWTGAKLSGNWTGADFSSQTDSTGKVIKQTLLVGATIDGDVTSSAFVMVDASRITVKGQGIASRWHGSVLEEGEFTGNFTSAKFKPYSWANGAAHQATNLRDATFEGVFKRANCEHADCQGIELSGSMQNSRWTGANLRAMQVGQGLRIAGGEFDESHNVPQIIRERSAREQPDAPSIQRSAEPGPGN